MSDTPPTLPPPGWYVDPSGVHGSRWWDGARWTDHVRDLPPGDDPPPLPADVGPADLPLSMRGRDRRVAVLAAAALLVGLAATVAIGVRAPSAGDAVDGQGRRLGQVAPGTQVPAPMAPSVVTSRAEAAGCTTVVDGAPLEDRSHLDPAQAPPSSTLYPDRPAHSGRHYGTLLALPDGTADAPIDERAVLHNMEHGSVVVWFDPDARAALRGEVADWRDRTADLGFTSRDGGAVFASPMPADVEDPPTVALRAWGVAVDCERFDPVVADAFLAEHFGSHGIAPEANLSPYPEDSLEIADPA